LAVGSEKKAMRSCLSILENDKSKFRIPNS
jgi:hypothetical protein